MKSDAHWSRVQLTDALYPMLHDRIMPLYIGAAWGPKDAGFVSVEIEKQLGRDEQLMTDAGRQPDIAQGIEGVLVANRTELIRFLEARGAGDAAEDVFQELWMRIAGRATGPIADPLAYLYRAANNLMLDRYRSSRQSGLRENAWNDAVISPGPSAEQSLISREELSRVDAAIDALGERPARIFRRFRLDGRKQYEIAAELGVSLSTVESDLRKVYATLVALQEQPDA